MTAVRDVRAFIRSRAVTPAGWLDRYEALFGLAMAGVVLAQPISSALAAISRPADPSRAGAGLALVLLAYAGFLAIARALGPVALPAADAAWLLLSPLHRRGVLGRTAALLLGVSVLAGAAFGVGALAVLGAPDQLTLRLVTAVLLGVSAGVGGMALTVLSQSSPTWEPWLNAVLVTTTLLAVAATLAAVNSPLRRLLAGLTNAPAPPGALLAGLAPAAVGMDPGALTWITEDNHWRGRVLRSRRWPRLPAPQALAWQEWRRLGRRPGRLAALFGSAVLPVLAARAAGGATAAVLGAVLAGALAAAVAGTWGARRDADNPALARLLGVGARAALAARSPLPALLGGAWLTLALTGLTLSGALAAGPWWLFGPLAAPALAAGALRMARRRPIDHTMPVIETAGGAVPTGPLIWGMTGVDVAVLGCLPLVVALAVQPPALTAFLTVQALTGTAALLGYLLRAETGGRLRA
ncbi:hypothetical protein GCM10010517_26330 [Streptosporangium fragile]|uniref:ABC transporter permease n=1 Tax=Streptosporangium fragile TaxID=46186 RepID=A0ABP6IBR7_9ACTN